MSHMRWVKGLVLDKLAQTDNIAAALPLKQQLISGEVISVEKPNVIYLIRYFAWPNQPSSGLDVTYL